MVQACPIYGCVFVLILMLKRVYLLWKLPSHFFCINQYACSTLDWVMNSQSEFDWVAYKHMIGNSQKSERIIPMLICPIIFYTVSTLLSCLSVVNQRRLCENSLMLWSTSTYSSKTKLQMAQIILNRTTVVNLPTTTTANWRNITMSGKFKIPTQGDFLWYLFNKIVELMHKAFMVWL